ncbi:MAG: peptidoglycan binding domain-containing protein [Actinomycetota bacterium]|nr:peptidoglycan binding domain-containing protein [Actinomycetota bacterium]
MDLKNHGKRERRRGYDRGGLPPDYSTGLRSTGGKRRSRSRGIAGPIIVICAIVAVLVAADYWVNSGRVHSGVEVGNVALGGQTPAAAHDIVRDRAMGPLKEIEFSGPERFSRTAGQMGVDFNVDETVEKAYAVGREGNLLERLSERLRSVFGGITIAPDIDYRPEQARAQVREIATQVDHQPREAEVKVYGSEVEVTESRDGYKLDPAATMASVDRAVDGMTGNARLVGDVLEPEVTTSEAETAAKKARGALSEQLVFKAEGKNWTVSPADLGPTLDITRQGGKLDVSLNRDRLDGVLASDVYNDLTVKPKEASYGFDADGDVIVSPSREGQTVEGEKLLDSIQSGLFEGKREYDVPLLIDKPTYTTAELEAQKPTELQGTYKTNYTATTDQGLTRVENLKIASKAVNGTFVAPGETFSMVEHIQDLDYNEAHVIVDSEEKTAEGGGLCQVTSTLYNAVLYAGLPVVERQPHDSQLPYIRPGMDATVWYGDTTTTIDDTDMKFKNTTDGYVLLQEYVADDGYIYANVYGVPDNVEVQMSSEKVWMTEDASQWITHYTRTNNGKVVYEDSWKSDYSALYDDKGKKIPTPKVPISEVNGTYNGVDFSSLE